MSAKAAETKQAKVEDVGGAFIYADDSKALAEWYKAALGIGLEYNAEEANYYYVFAHGKDVPEAVTVFSIHQAKSKLSGPKNQFMINFRVGEGFLDGLKAKGVAVDRTQDSEYGRFAWIKDPEGNPIELWQPK